ncbi:MAG: hypothetical protein VX026_08455 [Myxococcota bacterium]|nr:hypothetical protein [Myxococcota bacterium]
MNTNRKSILIAMLGLSACSYWNEYLDGPTWDTNVAVAEDGVYVNLPSAGLLVRVTEKGDFDVVDLNGAEPKKLVSAPDGTQVLVFSEWTECEDTSDDIVLIDDCDEEELVIHNELAIVQNGQLNSALSIPSHLNALTFSDDALTAVAYLDYSLDQNPQINGVADLGEVAFIRLSDGTRGSVSVGFSPSRVLFGPNNQAVVMSRSQVVAVDLNTFEKTLEAPLTLDADQQIDPSGAELAYDEVSGSTTLLLTVQGSSDLYMLDLGTEYWNIGDLGAIPSAIGVSSSESKSVFVFDSASKAVVLDNSDLSTLSSESIKDISLEEPANKAIIGDSFAVLYNDSNELVHDIYRLDLESSELVEYVVANPVQSLRLTESGGYAVGILKPEYNASGGLDSYQDNFYGVAILDMQTDDAVSLVAEVRPTDFVLLENDSGSYALVLMEDKEELLYIDLSNPSVPEEISLPKPPASIESLPDGQFLITHQVGAGMISFLDPENLDIKTVSGFAMFGLMEDDTLERRGEEK